MRTFLLGLIALSVVFTQGAFAEDSEASLSNSSNTSSTNLKSMMEKLEASKFDLLFVSDTQTQKNSQDDYAINGFVSENVVYFGYNPSENNNFRVDTSVVTADTKTSEAQNDWTGFGVRYKRGNILTEEKHGVNFSAENRIQFLPTQDAEITKQAGYNSPRLYFSKNIGKRVNLSTQLRWYEYIRTNSDPAVTRRLLRAYFIPSVSITDKLSFSNLFHYSRSIKGEGIANRSSEYVEVVPTLSYQATAKFGIDLYWDAVPFVSSDDDIWVNNWEKSAALGATLIYSAF